MKRISGIRRLAAYSTILVLSSVILECASISPALMKYRNEHFEQVMKIRELQEAQSKGNYPGAGTYRSLLSASGTVTRPNEFYRKKLAADLERVQSSDEAVLSWDSILAFPFFFNDRLGVICDIYTGLGEVYFHNNELEDAEKNALKAIETGKKYMDSPYYISKKLKASYNLLEKIYTKKGLKGKALLAKLNYNLAEDYLKSRQAFRENVFYRQNYYDAIQEIYKIDKLLNEINTERQRKADAQVAMAAGAMLQATSQLQQIQTSYALQRSGGVVTPQIRMMQMNTMLAQNTLNMISAHNKYQNTGFFSLNPGTSIQVLQQLINPSAGMNPRGIIKGFIRDVIKSTADRTVIGKAQRTLGQLDNVRQSGSKGDIQGALQSANQFLTAFNELQGDVEEIRGAVSGTSGER